MNQLLNALYITWNPSVGIKIGTFTLHYYSLMFVLAFGIGYYMMYRMFKEEKKDEKLLDPLLMYLVLGTILGARLGHVIFYQPELFKEDFFSVFLPFRFKPEFEFTGFQGLASHGAAIALIISIYLYNRKYLKGNLFWLLDRLAITVALAGFFIRMGNFFNSEIIGKPSSLPWAVLFVNQSHDYGDIVPRHPSQLYEAIGYLILFFVMGWLYMKTEVRNKLGWLFGFFFAVLWGIRFVVEFVKEPQGDEIINWLGIDTGQWLSIPLIIIGIIILVTSNKRLYKSK